MVDKINNEGHIIQVDEANSLYDHFEKVLSNTSYLRDITEDVIYDAYKSAVRRNHAREFTDFSQLHRDAYMRLKLRDLSYGAPKIVP